MKGQRSIIVSGDRNWWTPLQRETVGNVLDRLAGHWSRYMPMRLAHGAAAGVDSIADEMGKLLGYQVVPYQADWDRLGKWAGQERNGRMLDQERPVALLLAFHDRIEFSKGTRNMILQALADQVPVRLFDSQGRSLPEKVTLLTQRGRR